MENNIRDLLNIPLCIGDTILGISGIDRKIGKISEFEDTLNNNGQAMIKTVEGEVYFSQNVLKIDDIINANGEYFI